MIQPDTAPSGDPDPITTTAWSRPLILTGWVLAATVATCLAIGWGGWWSFGLIGFISLPFWCMEAL